MITILFNGPPGSGKDTLGAYINHWMHGKHLQFKSVLLQHTIDYYGVNSGGFVSYCRTQKSKNVKRKSLDGISAREALIHVSENVYKPVFGNDYFGKHAAIQVQRAKEECYKVCVFTDSGFIEELIPVAEVSDLCIVVRIQRPQHTYSGDSRRYLQNEELPINCVPIDVHNTKAADLVAIELMATLQQVIADNLPDPT